MAKKLDLRKKAAPSAQETTIPEPEPVNQLPFPTGEKIQLTPEEQDFLKAAGWQEGDPIPDLAKFLESVVEDSANAAADIAASGTQTVAPTMVNFEDLPEEKQKELTESFENLRNMQQENPTSVMASEEAAPGVAEAIRVASQDDGVDVVDDPAQAIEPVKNPDPIGIVQKPDRTCPHCGWDTNIKETAVITSKDKQDFLMSVLGGIRFYKDCRLFGGSVTVRYRTLTTAEADIALQQTSYDFRDGKVPDQGEFYRVYNNYRLAMSIDRVSTPSAMHPVPVIADVEWDAPARDELQQTALPTLEAWLYDNILSSESMRRVTGLEHQRFQRLVEKLEARVDDSDFWKGTAPEPS